MTDEKVESTVHKIRTTLMKAKKHPESCVHEFMVHNTDAEQRRRLWGCEDALQAARRATHGDAFRY